MGRSLQLVVLVVAIQAIHAIGKFDQALPSGSHTTSTGENSPASGSLSDIQAAQRQIVSAGRSRTWITIMPFRYSLLRWTLAGYQQTGVPLVATDGKNLAPAERGDDAGLLYFVPAMVRLLGVSLEKGIDLFFGGIIVLSFLSGNAGLSLLLRDWGSRSWALIALLLVSATALWLGDVYVVESSIAIALAPWFLYFAQERKHTRAFFAFVPLAGVSIGISNLIRAHSGTAVLLFAACVVLFQPKCNWIRKLLLLCPLTVGFLIVLLCFHTLFVRRNNFLELNHSHARQISEQHVFWHPVYLGFGFLSNDYVPAYNDTVAAAKVYSISPTAHYLSPEYEQILKGETFRLVREHPRFVLLTLFAKLGVIGCTLLLSANFGLLAAIWYPKPWAVESAFWLAIAFNSLFGILVVPRPNYLLGFIAFAALYGIVSVGHAIECYRAGDIRSWLRFLRKKALCAA